MRYLDLIVGAFVYSMVNPICMAASFVVAIAGGFYVPTNHTNEFAFDMRWFPMYLSVGVIALLFQGLVAQSIAERLWWKRPVPYAKSLQAFFYAQRPFVFLVLAVPLLLTEIEGNAVVFFGIFAFPVVLVAFVLAITRFSKRLQDLMATATGDPVVAILAD
jgi:hypothetical protein